jgi:hypothetical protein
VIRRGRVVAETEPPVARLLHEDGSAELVTFTPA